MGDEETKCTKAATDESQNKVKDKFEVATNRSSEKICQEQTFEESSQKKTSSEMSKFIPGYIEKQDSLEAFDIDEHMASNKTTEPSDSPAKNNLNDEVRVKTENDIQKERDNDSELKKATESETSKSKVAKQEIEKSEEQKNETAGKDEQARKISDDEEKGKEASSTESA